MLYTSRKFAPFQVMPFGIIHAVISITVAFRLVTFAFSGLPYPLEGSAFLTVSLPLRNGLHRTCQVQLLSDTNGLGLSNTPVGIQVVSDVIRGTYIPYLQNDSKHIPTIDCFDDAYRDSLIVNHTILSLAL